MRRFLVRSIPIVALSLFVVIMFSGTYMKKPRNESENIDKFINTTITYVKSENWHRASQEADKLELAWKRILKRMQFSSELDQINYLSESISKAKGGIAAKDMGISLSNLIAFYEKWRTIGE